MQMFLSLCLIYRFQFFPIFEKVFTKITLFFCKLITCRALLLCLLGHRHIKEPPLMSKSLLADQSITKLFLIYLFYFLYSPPFPQTGSRWVTIYELKQLTISDIKIIWNYKLYDQQHHRWQVTLCLGSGVLMELQDGRELGF